MGSKCQEAIEEVLVYENDLYKVVVGPSTLNDEIESDVYKIVNKEYGVVEEETLKLPQAMYIAAHLFREIKQEGWDKAIKNESDAASPIALAGKTPPKLVS